MTTNNGISGGLEQTTLPVAMTLSAFTAIAWYNVVDLNVVIWMTFKRRHGLYFYSLLFSSWGIFIYSLSFLMKFFQVWKSNYVSVALITIGWYSMVTGQSLVLYSRLHLVVRDTRKVRWVLYMIIIDVFLFHVPTTVLTFGVSVILYIYRRPTNYLLGQFAFLGNLYPSVFDYGKDSSHSLLHPRIYHLWPLRLLHTRNAQSRRDIPKETQSSNHVALDLC